MNNRIIMLLVGVLLYKLSIAQITGKVRVNPNEITVSQKDGYDVIQWSKGRKYKTWVVTENRDWQGGAFVNDIIVRSGTLRISSGKDLQMPDACRIYVMYGGTLEVDGGVITNANVLIKDGGKLKLTNGGTICVSQYGEIETELGAEVEFLSGEIVPDNELP